MLFKQLFSVFAKHNLFNANIVSRSTALFNKDGLAANLWRTAMNSVVRNNSYMVMKPTAEENNRMKTLLALHQRGPVKPRVRRHPLEGKPQMKGVVLKTVIKKPKKPNSANRKCVLVRLSNGKEAVAFVPGVGHNLQEHSVVLVHKKRTKDVPGLKLRVMRGIYDCAPIVKKSNS